MKLINTSLPTLTNNLAQPWTTGSIAFTYQAMKELAQSLAYSIQQTVGGTTTFATGSVYNLYGVNVYVTNTGGSATLNVTPGAILYNGEIYLVQGAAITYPAVISGICYGALTTINSPTYGDPTTFNDSTLHSINNDRIITPILATSSSGTPAAPAGAFVFLGGGQPSGGGTFNTNQVIPPTVPAQIQANNTALFTSILDIIKSIGNNNGGLFYPTYGQQWISQTIFALPWAIGAQQPRYLKEGWTGRVQLNGLVQTTASAATNTTIFTLPVGFRPTQYCQFACLAYNSTAGTYYTQYVIVRVSGTVEVIGNVFPTGSGWIIDLSSVSFMSF